MWGRRLVVAAALVAVAGSAGGGQREVRVAGDWRRWESAHFVAYSNA